MGHSREHHCRGYRLALGAAAAGVRAAGGPADARTGRGVLRAGTGGARTGRHGPGHRFRRGGRLPAAGAARDHGYRGGYRPGHAHHARRAGRHGGAGSAHRARCLAGRRAAGRPGRPGDLPPRGLQRPRGAAVPHRADQPCPVPGGDRVDRGAPADLAQPVVVALPRTAAAHREAGVSAGHTEWSRPAEADYADFDELVDVTRRRLCLPPDRTSEVEAALLDLGSSRERPGDLGSSGRDVVTIWWEGTA